MSGNCLPEVMHAEMLSIQIFSYHFIMNLFQLVSIVFALRLLTVHPHVCSHYDNWRCRLRNFSYTGRCRVFSPGLLWQLRPSDVEVELLAHTRNVISKDLEEETGLHTGWIQNGGLFIASNKQRLDEYKRLMSVRIGKGFVLAIMGK